MKSEPKKTYVVAVCVKLGDHEPYRVDVTTDDEIGAMLLAQLLKEHDSEVLLLERSETTERRTLRVRKWPRKRKS